MNASEIIDKVYAELEPQLTPPVVSTLKFRTEATRKNGVIQTAGRMFGKQAGKVWDRQWCYYSLSFGADRNNPSRIGGVGFGCAVNQQCCGKGKHESALFEIGKRFCTTHPQFHTTLGDGWWLSVATPYHSFVGRDFPIKQAAQDLAALINSTFASIDELIVAPS